MTLAEPRASAAAELARTAALPFEQATAMPPSVYTSETFLARETECLFRREWICLGRASTMADPGDYIAADIAGQPVLVVRGRDGVLRAMSNVCLHRMSTLLEGRGNTRTIACPYHAWTYNLDGTLRRAPLMEEREGFDTKAHCLPAIRSEEWLGWVYVTLNPDAVPVSERLAKLAGLIAPYGMENYSETFHESHVWDTNWKLLAENYMESYHLPICHRGTVGPYTALSEVVCPPGEPEFNLHWFTKDAGLGIGNAHPDNERLTGDQRRTSALVSIYPSHLITLTPGYFWYLSLQPRGTGRVEMIYGGGFAPEFMADTGAEAYNAGLREMLARVNAEDRGCTEAVFRGLSAGLARPGRLSRLERPIYDFARYIAAQTAQ